jgi:hypothetical protein
VRTPAAKMLLCFDIPFLHKWHVDLGAASGISAIDTRRPECDKI